MRFHIITFGCQMNVYDSGRLSSLLEKNGWEPTPKQADADFIFINTCSIREKAANRVISRLKEMGPLKKNNPRLVIAVGGCVAEQEGVDLIGKAPIVDLVIGPRRLSEIPLLLKHRVQGDPPVILSGDPPSFGKDEGALILGGEDNYPLYPSDSPKESPLSAFITIMEGCDNFCAYCVVPYLRGKERSRPSEDIIREALSLLAKGTREITLLGQNVNSYNPPLNPSSPLKSIKTLASPEGSGREPSGEDAFAALLREIAALPDLMRLRFTTSHPKDISPELIDLFGSLPKLSPHIHLPLQSGSNKILAAMGRRYDRERYLGIISKLRENSPGIAITTDLIVGFPGESLDNFEETLSILKEIRFDSIFSFKYSDRPGTKAIRLRGKVPEDEKGRRLDIIIKTQKEISREINQKLMGTTTEVLVDGLGKLPGQLSGRTGTFKIVNFPGPEELVGSLVPVLITETGPISLKGRLAHDAGDTDDSGEGSFRKSYSL
jgi:tRNA-2-methylthio-N6-dimethylallyladenosine synthase